MFLTMTAFLPAYRPWRTMTTFPGCKASVRGQLDAAGGLYTVSGSTRVHTLRNFTILTPRTSGPKGRDSCLQQVLSERTNTAASDSGGAWRPPRGHGTGLGKNAVIETWALVSSLFLAVDTVVTYGKMVRRPARSQHTQACLLARRVLTVRVPRRCCNPTSTCCTLQQSWKSARTSSSAWFRAPTPSSWT